MPIDNGRRRCARSGSAGNKAVRRVERPGRCRRPQGAAAILRVGGHINRLAEVVELLRRTVQREVDRLVERRRRESDIGHVENPASGVGVAGRVADVASTFDTHPQRDVVDDEVAQLFAAVGVWQPSGPGVPLLRHLDIDGNGRGRSNLAAGVTIRRQRGIGHRCDIDRIGAVELCDGIGQSVPAGVTDGVPDGKPCIGVAVGSALHIDVRGVSC